MNLKGYLISNISQKNKSKFQNSIKNTQRIKIAHLFWQLTFKKLLIEEIEFFSEKKNYISFRIVCKIHYEKSKQNSNIVRADLPDLK